MMDCLKAPKHNATSAVVKTLTRRKIEGPAAVRVRRSQPSLHVPLGISHFAKGSNFRYGSGSTVSFGARVPGTLLQQWSKICIPSLFFGTVTSDRCQLLHLLFCRYRDGPEWLEQHRSSPWGLLLPCLSNRNQLQATQRCFADCRLNSSRGRLLFWRVVSGSCPHF